MNVSTYNSWETPHTTIDDNTLCSEDDPRGVYWTSPLNETFYSEGEPLRMYLLSSPLPPSPPRKMKRKLEIGMSFTKKGESRNMSAKPAVRRSPQQRTSQVHQTIIRTFKLTFELLNLCFYPLKYFSHHVLFNSSLG